MKACWIKFQLTVETTLDFWHFSYQPCTQGPLSSFASPGRVVPWKENERAWKQGCFGSSFLLIYSLLQVFNQQDWRFIYLFFSPSSITILLIFLSFNKQGLD